MTEASEALDRFQQVVLAALHGGGEPAELRAQVARCGPDADLSAWVASWDDDLVALASLLVQTWAVRDEPGSDGGGPLPG